MTEEKEKPLTREDVLKAIEKNGGTAKGLDLSGKKFRWGIDLRKLDLEGIILKEADLTHANLERARLWHAHLERAVLQRAHLEGTNLEIAHLEEADLGRAHLEGADLRVAHLEGANLRVAYLEGADLRYAHLEGADLFGAHLEGANLMGAYFSTETKFENVKWGNYILREENDGYFGNAQDTYRRLKMWYTEHGMYDIAGEFFFREMTAKRKALKWWPNPFPRAWSKFISLICGYGERPLRVIAWAASVIVISTLVYFLIGSVWQWSSFWNSLYFSAVSFTALGYGSWVNTTNDLIRGIGAFESFVGVFTIALFLVTFTRKMTR